MTGYKDTHSFCEHSEDSLGNQAQDIIIKIRKIYKGDKTHNL